MKMKPIEVYLASLHAQRFRLRHDDFPFDFELKNLAELKSLCMLLQMSVCIEYHNDSDWKRVLQRREPLSIQNRGHDIFLLTDWFVVTKDRSMRDIDAKMPKDASIEQILDAASVPKDEFAGVLSFERSVKLQRMTQNIFMPIGYQNGISVDLIESLKPAGIESNYVLIQGVSAGASFG